MTFNALKERIQKKFDFTISLSNPYKLCDFKPAYGDIFEDEVRDYDFWGYCDNDMIYGDIKSFISDSDFDKCDKLLSRGHLSFYRNCPEMNLFYKNHTNDFYKTVFSDNSSFSFDEWGPVGICNNLKQKLQSNRFWDEIVFDDMHVLHSNFVPVQRMAEGARNIIYSYENGVLTRYYIKDGVVRHIPVLYVHFQKRSMRVHTENHNRYLIVPNKFIPFQEPTASLLRKYGARKLINQQYLKIKYKNAMRRLKKLCRNV